MARAIATPPAETAKPARTWTRPAAIGAGILSAALAGLAIHQGLAARGAYADADAMVLPGGALRAPYTSADHQAALDAGDAARRNAWLAGTSALLSAGAAAALSFMAPPPAASAPSP